ncbi:S-adenosylmethionine decarboxylase family protein [Psychrobacter lutiphocae]|uniref:S-adenosylmethionine decarboxylase family protein n=1 Tax=Psychrobacter lutiphocae TaxID=540500 RepID=UPI00035EADAF|nr:S-adenosylmethionine decarboxylase [Psychrobacter lutiphocae]
MLNSQSKPAKLASIPLDARSQLNGKHILAEFWQCQCVPELLTQTQPLLDTLIQAVAKEGLTLVGHAAHEFQPLDSENIEKDAVERASQTQSSGVTLTLLLAESHLCLHTWGEQQTVTLDVYVCNVTEDNSDKAEALFTACLNIFAPAQYHSQQVIRQHQLSAADYD